MRIRITVTAIIVLVEVCIDKADTESTNTAISASLITISIKILGILI